MFEGKNAIFFLIYIVVFIVAQVKSGNNKPVTPGAKNSIELKWINDMRLWIFTIGFLLYFIQI